ISREGNCAMPTEISRIAVQMRIAWRKSAIRSVPSPFWNRTRLRLGRLQAVSSRNMYSEQGFEARMGPSLGQVCHSLMVSVNCTPGSADSQADMVMESQSASALSVFMTRPSVRAVSFQSPPARADSRKLLGTRTELLEFCPLTVA